MSASITIPPVRFVRCPNCRHVLRELPEIPVYKCGGCGTVLRAKHHVGIIEGGTSSGSLDNNAQNLSNIHSLNRANEQHEKEEICVRNEEENKPEQHEEEEICVRNEEEHKPEDKIHSDEQTEKSMYPSPIDCDSSSKSNDKIEKSLEEEIKFAPGSSSAYYASSSSPDMSRENRPNKFLPLSKRTFKHKKILDSEETEAKVQSQMLPEVRNESPPRPRIHAIERDNTFRSEDFHSVQNWTESDTDEVAQKPQSRSFRFQNDIESLDPDHAKILRKVDELRDELSGFLAKTVEGKRAHHLKHQFPSYYPKHQAEENGIEKIYPKEKKISPIKRYCRPVYNGAPFVMCYKCWNLLQLPADFLVTRKRLHKLKCGSCSEILVFSFRPRDLNASMTPNEALHPPSEVENYNSKSYSDDYRSRSSDFEADKKLNVSRNSSYSIRESRLHRLMGYSSASELLFRPPLDDGYESTEPITPHFYRPKNSLEIEEGEGEEEPNERLKTRMRSALHGLLKKGVQKLKIHSNG